MVVKNLLENKCLNVELGSLPLLQRWREAEEATAWDTVSAVNGLWRKVGKFYLLGRVTEKALIGRGEIKLVYTSLYCRHVVLQATADGLAELLYTSSTGETPADLPVVPAEAAVRTMRIQQQLFTERRG